MKRTDMPNAGLPMFIDPIADLTHVPSHAFMDSWYFNSTFEVDGRPVGFQYHQMIQATPFGVICQSAFSLLDSGTRKCYAHDFMVPVDEKNGADEDKLNVYSDLGTLTGDEKVMHLKLAADGCTLDVTLENKGDLLINGTMGMLRFIACDSYQFAWPNFVMNGTLTIDGKEYKLVNEQAWFDRQWGVPGTEIPGEHVMPLPDMLQVSWSWFGMCLTPERDEFISFWDAVDGRGRHSFATVLDKTGRQFNVLCDVTYSDLWTGTVTDPVNTYPRTTHVVIDEIDLDITLHSCIDNPEIGTPMIAGCQDLCHATGSYKGQPIDTYIIFEITNDICGEL